MRGELGFAVIRFPLKSGVGYYSARIDLFREFPAIVAGMRRGFGGGQADDSEPNVDFYEEEGNG